MPLDQRITQLRQHIHQHPGDDSNLRDRLNQLKARRAGQGATPDAGPAPTPWSGQYESTVGLLNQQRDDTLLGLDASEQETRKRYGFEDTSDPFSRANQLQTNFQHANTGTTNNYAAAGQLYAGSLTNAHNIDRTNYEQAYDVEYKQYQQDLAEIAQRKLQAGTDYDQELLDAEAKKLEDAAATRVDPAEAPAPDQPGGKNKKHKDDKPKKGHK